jgi:hypothetical protein
LKNIINKNERKFYKAVDQQKRGFQPRVIGCKSKDGRILGEEKEVLDQWTEHFEELLKVGKENEDPEIARRNAGSVVDEDDDGQREPPTYEEVECNIQKLKNNKALGKDNITAELIKYGGKAVREVVHKLITLIWETEQIPDNWRIGIICPILKKGDNLDCNNYTGITLLNILYMYKVLSSLINEKLKIATKSITGEYQCGFCPNKSTTDQLFIIRQMMQKHYAYGLDLHVLFTDFTQAFDSVNREKLFEITYEYGISKILIRLVQMSMSTTKAKVKDGNNLGKEFEFNKGVKHGDGLSTTLFILALHKAAMKIDRQGTIYNKSSQICAYADDIAIIARTKRKLTPCRRIPYLTREAFKSHAAILRI